MTKLDKQFKLILAIETSCDDTSVALVNADEFVVSMKSQNQDDVHAPYGGVIPELACRNHTLRILPLLDQVLTETKTSWSDIDGIAVTSKPGLIGSLLIGVTTAKSLAYLHDLPLIGVNHLEGHLHAPLLKNEDYAPSENFDYPFVGLCVSGGHTSLHHVKNLGKYTLLGRTLDDAAGEAFDKFGKILGLGYPAGHRVDHLAKEGNNKAFEFPRPLMKNKELSFSFSGLKTAGAVMIEKIVKEQNVLNADGLSKSIKADLCASYQEAIVEVLLSKLKRAVEKTKSKRAVVTGGVSANSRLRNQAFEWAKQAGVDLLIPPLKYCTDNAAMIGIVGLRRLQNGERSDLSLSPEAFMKVSELV
ncbi:MAG: tRNA (adenosine(37)-N6)-threonylcarbamoyltransferase complex transferase subunit TsaD [Oligoflexia bacterium]|nr:tRNA (adenosine(37)-N6)-threonylcarbamoyltransferase complex transferase subunit TsaD [Oligoflexia bacterium]